MNAHRGLAAYHPLPCFLYFCGVLGFALLLQNPLYALTSTLAALVMTGFQSTFSGRGKLFIYYAAFAAVTFLINPLFSHRGRHILFYFRDRAVTLEAVLFGLVAGLTLLAVLLWFVAVQVVLTPEKWMFLFHAWLPKGVMLLSMAMRSYRLLLKRIAQVAAVQRTRGINPLRGNLRNRLQDGTLLLKIALTWSLEEGLQAADSMKARGYGSGARTHYWPNAWQRRDSLLLSAISMLGFLTLAGWMSGMAHFAVYPELEPLPLSWGELAEYMCYLGFTGIPVWLEGKDVRKWRKLS